MGLAEKRAIKEFQDGEYPGLKSSLDEACGFDVEMVVDWDTVTEDGMGHMISESMARVYFQPVIDGLKSITADDMGKEALKESLKKVVFCNNGDNSSASNSIKFEDGVLTVDHKPYSNIGEVDGRTKAVISILEQNL